MRSTLQPQLSFIAPLTNNDRLAELQEIDKALDANPEVVEFVHKDLVRDIDPSKGRAGLAAETVLRVLILKQTYDFTYEDLEFYLGQTPAFRWFCRLDCDQRPKKSPLQRDIKKLQPETLQAVCYQIARYAIEHGVETGRKVRSDCTGVETMIHAPTDSSLLADSVRVLTRTLLEARKISTRIAFCDHTLRANRRAKAIEYARGKERRRSLYRDLLKVTEKTVGYAERAIEELETTVHRKAGNLAAKLRHYVDLARKVISQARRRVIDGESVPVADKIVSIFEPHTDIIIKSRRETIYGHKLCLTAGASGLILDADVLEGNPADSTLTVEMMKRLKETYDKVPRQATFDGAFSSIDNLVELKALGIKDAVFQKSRGIEIEDMASSKRVYKRLRNFRAGIEATISFLKRSFALSRCTWRGLASFKSYVFSSILSANLLIIARHALR